MKHVIQVRMFGKYCTLYEGNDVRMAVEYLNLLTYHGFTFNVRIHGG